MHGTALAAVEHPAVNRALIRRPPHQAVEYVELADEMASDEVAEAQRQAREWLAHG